MKGSGKGSGGGPRASVQGGVGGRGTGPKDGANFATCAVFLSFLRALIPGEGVREGLAWRGKGSGGVQGHRFRGGRCRGTGIRDGANFATCVVFLKDLTKRRKMAFFEGCPVG